MIVAGLVVIAHGAVIDVATPLTALVSPMQSSFPTILRACRPFLVLIVMLIATGNVGCRPRSTTPQPVELLVFAAASLHDALAEAGDAYESASGVEAVFNFAASNVLARQLMAAPRADVFVSANREWLDHVATGGHIDHATRTAVASNALAVVAHQDHAFQLDRLDDLAAVPFRHLALGDPNAVPAGRYARAVLERIEDPRGGTVWSRVADRVVPAPDARAAAALVAAHDDMVGLVYRTDGRATPDLRVLLDVAPVPGVDIRYEAAVLRHRTHAAAARSFVTFLTSAKGQAIFARHGFLPRPAPAS